MAKKKLRKAILAGLTAYAAAKMMKKAPVEGLSTDKFDMKAKKVFMHDLEAKAPIKGGTGVPDFVKMKKPDTYRSTVPKKWYEFWKKHGGSVTTAKLGKMIKAAQGTYAHEDESLGMRLGKGKGTAKERDMSYGKWGNRGKDWKTAKTGSMIKAKHGTMVTGGTAYVKTKLNGTLKVKTF